MIEKIKEYIKERNALMAVGEEMGILGETIDNKCFMFETQFMEMVKKYRYHVEPHWTDPRPDKNDEWYKVDVDGIEIRTILDKKQVEELKGEGLICEK